MRRLAYSLILLAAVCGTAACDWPQPGSFVIDSPKDSPGIRVRNAALPETQPDPVPTPRPPSAQPVAPPPGSVSGPGAGADASGSGAGGTGSGGSGSGGASQGSGAVSGAGSFQGTLPSGTGPTGDDGPATRPSLEPDCKRARLHGVEPLTGATLDGGFVPEPASVAIALRLVSQCFPITIVAARLTYVWRDATGTLSLVPVVVRLAVPVTLNPSSDGPVTTVPVDLRSLQLEPFLKGLRTSGELSAQVQFVQADGTTVQGASGSELTVEVPVEIMSPRGGGPAASPPRG